MVAWPLPLLSAACPAEEAVAVPGLEITEWSGGRFSELKSAWFSVACEFCLSVRGFCSFLLTFDFAIVLLNSIAVQTPRTENAIWKAGARESSGQKKIL